MVNTSKWPYLNITVFQVKIFKLMFLPQVFFVGFSLYLICSPLSELGIFIKVNLISTDQDKWLRVWILIKIRHIHHFSVVDKWYIHQSYIIDSWWAPNNLSNQNIWYNLGETSHARVNDWILVYEGEMQHDAYYV